MAGELSMSQSACTAIPLPNPDEIRERIDQLDAEAAFLRRLLRLISRTSKSEPLPTRPEASRSEAARAH
jgi:hypothetical protein